MSKHHAVIRYPSVTEKNTALRSDQNKYVFEVAPRSTKTEIREAIEKLFNVKVLSVNTMVVKGKKKRTGRFVGYRPNWKKAIVKIADGQSIDKFGEV
ncbi:MAG: 50S ribosomal protein L23 [Chitinivibrionales bacterium]|nr:50S ribosomal protein L23 [Chitinivibrionales bacterium]MBD3396947.1 50S ribosomal protein L23 [Chitinivibrionales bacterium]